MSVSDTRKVVDGYTKAWMNGDFDAARAYLADDVKFRGSIDQFDRADDFIIPLRAFSQLLVEVNKLEEFYDEDSACLLYDCVTDTPAGTVRTAEFFTVTNGKIVEIRLVFDATELRKLMGR